MERLLEIWEEACFLCSHPHAGRGKFCSRIGPSSCWAHTDPFPQKVKQALRAVDSSWSADPFQWLHIYPGTWWQANLHSSLKRQADKQQLITLENFCLLQLARLTVSLVWETVQSIAPLKGLLKFYEHWLSISSSPEPAVILHSHNCTVFPWLNCTEIT